jgi:superfamily II DNA or RNA helicase
MQTLKDFQSKAVGRIYNNWSNGDQGVLFISPTGTGKTTVAAYITNHLQAHGKRILFLAHRKELIEQCFNRFSGYGFDIDLIHKKDTGAAVALSTIPSAVRRDLPYFDLIIIDEAHRSQASSYQIIANRYKGSRFLGLTAYPYRMDGKALGRGQGGIYDSYVDAISMIQAIEQGDLSPIFYVAPKSHQINAAGVKKIGGDYNTKQLFERSDVQELYEGVAENLLEFGQESTVVFCINREHAHKTSEMLTRYGFKSVCVDSKTPKTKREYAYQQMLNREIDALCNCQIYVEGIDIPNLDTVVLNLKTMSEGKYRQMIGRVTRPSPSTGKTKAVAIDMGSNWVKHGYAEWPFEINLELPKGPKGDAPLKVCPGCQAVIPSSASICPNCGHEFESEEKELSKDDFVEFSLSNTAVIEPKKKEIIVPSHLRKRYTAMTDQELKEIATIRGYKKGWVWHMKKLRG